MIPDCTGWITQLSLGLQRVFGKQTDTPSPPAHGPHNSAPLIGILVEMCLGSTLSEQRDLNSNEDIICNFSLSF